jgi:hypothetical protein
MIKEFSSLPENIKETPISSVKYDCGWFISPPPLLKAKEILNSAVVDTLDNVTLPEDCFIGIDQRCTVYNETIEFSCSNNEISENLAFESLLEINPTLTEFLKTPLSVIDDPQLSSSISHISICLNSTESSWIEVIKLSSQENVVLIQQTPMFTAVSFLHLNTKSFGTSSVQYGCYSVNGKSLEFSSIVGGIVAGYTLSESQYDCTLFEESSANTAGNETSKAYLTNEKEFYDLPDDTGLAIEYTIVCIYIALSYLAALKAYQLHMKQRTRTDFKTNVNLSFVIFFLVWASGNLLYTILVSMALTDTNFFYIKSVLTVTYFSTYLGFTLIVHYRYRLIFSLL